MAVDLTPFIKDAQKLQDQTGIPASITLGQIILESSGSFAGGLSGLAAQAKNLFGIKGTGSAGSVSMPTHEYRNGQLVSVFANFRSYNSYYESMADHAKVLSADRYAKYLSSAKSINDYAAGIAKGGYATDPNYSSKLLGIISTYNLHQYDTGNFTFTPVSTSSAGSSSSSGSSSSDSTGSGLYFNIVRSVLVLGAFVLMVIFFLKAFPATEDLMDVGVGAAKAAATGGGSIAKDMAKQASKGVM
jgi:flagellar protein FlgJ